MINKYLERELKENLLNHEIFEHQANEDLTSIRTFLDQGSSLTEIIVEFDGEKIANSKLLYTFPYDSYKNNLIWEQLVAIQIMKQLGNKLNKNFRSNLCEMESLIYESTKEDYLIYKDKLPTREDIMRIIGSSNTVIRLHFIIQYLHSDSLCDELSKYITGYYPITMIYSDCEFYTESVRVQNHEPKISIYDACNYFLFREFEEGENSKVIMMEQERKQKVKRYEEV